MRATLALGILGAGLALLAPARSRADVVTMPPSCPPGSMDAFCHGPATCAPRGCVSSTDCSAGEVCAARDLCTETHSCFGFSMGSFVNHVLGACDASGACATGGICASFFVCSPGPVTPDAGHPGVDAGVVPEHATYCGCRAGSRGGSVTSSVLVLAALGLFVARRQR